MRLLLVFAILACAIGALLPCSASAGEFRAFWADAWGDGFKTPAKTTQLVDFAAEYGFNAVFIQVRKRGDACYKSSFEPMDPKVQKGYDPLADVIEKAHAKGIEVHAWVMVYDVWVESRFVTLPEDHVYARHPDWASLNNKGEKTYANGRIYLDPGLPEVREYLTRIVLDIVKRYPVDGIHLDGLRYCDATFGYNPRSVEAFNARHNRTGSPDPKDPEWCAWRKEQVDILARDLPRAIRKARPKVKVSLAAYYNQDDIRNRFFQDWPGWAKAGYYDFIVPMVFVPKTVKDFISMVKTELALGDGSNIYIGQGTWRYPPETTNRHLAVIRACKAPGFVLFDYAALSQKDKKGKCLADKLKIVE